MMLEVFFVVTPNTVVKISRDKIENPHNPTLEVVASKGGMRYKRHKEVWCEKLLVCPVVALFETEDEALACFKNKDLHTSDSRWTEKTREIERRISESFPYIKIEQVPGVLIDPPLPGPM